MLTVISGAPPSPSGSPGSSAPSKQTYYRPSLAMAIRHLQRKVEYFAAEDQFYHFDHLVRGLGRDGLLDAGPGIQLAQGSCATDHSSSLTYRSCTRPSKYRTLRPMAQ